MPFFCAWGHWAKVMFHFTLALCGRNSSIQRAHVTSQRDVSTVRLHQRSVCRTAKDHPISIGAYRREGSEALDFILWQRQPSLQVAFDHVVCKTTTTKQAVHKAKRINKDDLIAPA